MPKKKESPISELQQLKNLIGVIQNMRQTLDKATLRYCAFFFKQDIDLIVRMRDDSRDLRDRVMKAMEIAGRVTKTKKSPGQ